MDTYDAEKYIDQWQYQFLEQRHAADAIARARANVVDKPAQPDPPEAPTPRLGDDS